MKIEAVLFDMFDTLMMIERDHAFYSPSLKKTYDYLKGKGIEVTFTEFQEAYVEARDALYAKADPNMEEPHFNLRISKALRNLGYDYPAASDIVTGATNAFCETFMQFVSADNSALESLRILHGKYKLGIVSNFAIPECVFKLLKRHDIEALFDVVVVSGAVNKRKPSPDIFKKALDLLKVSADNAVFVGDTIDADIQGAKGAGMKTIYIERRTQPTSEESKPDHCIKTMSDLPFVLERC
jgi:putative hydrolase of the HAD superfamily